MQCHFKGTRKPNVTEKIKYMNLKKGELKKKKKYIEKSLSQHGQLASGEVFNYLFTP